jgi:hypothetical protein
MKLLPYRLLGRDRPGCLDETAQLRDLGGHISDLAGDNLGVSALAPPAVGYRASALGLRGFQGSPAGRGN